jgi:hypothetical protein
MCAVRFDLEWRCWLATAVLLTFGLMGRPAGVSAAIVLTAVQLAHFARRGRGCGTLPLQVRLLFFAALLLGLWPPLAFLHVLQLAGTWANVLFGYCPAARLLSLMPWNRRVPLSVRLIVWTFLSPPAQGSILERVPPSFGPRAKDTVERASAAGSAAARSSLRP